MSSYVLLFALVAEVARSQFIEVAVSPKHTFTFTEAEDADASPASPALVAAVAAWLAARELFLRLSTYEARPRGDESPEEGPRSGDDDIAGGAGRSASRSRRISASDATTAPRRRSEPETGDSSVPST